MQKNWKATFALIFAGQAFSIVGSGAVQFAIIWWLTVRTGSAVTLAMSSLVGMLPYLFIGPFAGVLIDRYDRKAIMMLADGLVALSSLALGVIWLVRGDAPIWLFYVTLFVRGIGSTFHGPAMQATIPLLVPVEMLTKVGGWTMLVNSLGNMVGPALGALLMETSTLPVVMAVDVVGAIFAVGCLAFVKIPETPRTAQTAKLHIFEDFKQGFRAVRNNKPLVAALPAVLICTIAYMPLGALFPLLVKEHFGGTAWHNGLVEVVFAGGLFVSSLVIGIWGGSKRRFLMISAAIAGLGVTAALSGLLPPSWFFMFVILSFFMGGTGTFFNVPLMAYTQESIPNELQGKAFSLIMSAMSFAMPVGLLISGPVSEIIGVDTWFFISGLVIALSGLLCFFFTAKYDKPAAGGDV